MEDYFSSTLSKLQTGEYGELTIVLGNESCDLDSAVSSLVYAIFLHWQYQQIRCKVCTRNKRDERVHKENIFISILNVDRADYELKTEVAFALRDKGIKDNQLIFRNDHDLKLLVEAKKPKVVLVDHHTLSAKDTFLAPLVTEIIDHRPIDKSSWVYAVDTRSTIEMVGSCCTLVGRRASELATLMNKGVEFFNTYLECTDLLHSTIILDTVNFSKTVNKGTPQDEEIVLLLETILKPSDYEAERRSKLDRLTAARSDVSSLTAAQLLRKDVKMFGHVLVPSFPILVQDFLLKPNVKEALKEAMTQRKCTVTLLLGMDLQDGLKRDTAIYANETEKAAKLSSLLENWSSPPLQLTPSDPPSPVSHYYKQMNLSASRKQYIPALNQYLDNNK